MVKGRPLQALPPSPRPDAGRLLSLAPGSPTRFSELLRQRKPPVQAFDEPQSDREEERPEDLVDGEAAQVALKAADPPTTERAPDAPPSDEIAVLDPAQVAAAAAIEEPWRQVMRDVSAAISSFCNDRAVGNSDGWQVQMELRPDVIADTTLNLSLSPHWLVLRFHARNEVSQDLLSKGQQDLVSSLENSLVRKREISISFDSS